MVLIHTRLFVFAIAFTLLITEHDSLSLSSLLSCGLVLMLNLTQL